MEWTGFELFFHLHFVGSITNYEPLLEIYQELIMFIVKDRPVKEAVFSD
jgi:hypothetical protein